MSLGGFCGRVELLRVTGFDGFWDSGSTREDRRDREES